MLARRTFSLFLIGCVFHVVSSAVSATEPADVITVTAEQSNFFQSLREFVRNAIDGSASSLSRKLAEAEISASCSIGLLKLMRGIRNLEPWAARLLDSSGKYPTGIFQGTQADLGAFDECIETVVHDRFGNEFVRGQYCNLYVKTGNDTSFVEELGPALLMSHRRALRFVKFQDDPRVTGIRFGICTLTDCNQEDLQALVETLAGEGGATLTIKNCVTSKPTPMTGAQIAIIAALGILATVIAVATAVDTILYLKEQQASPQKLPMKCLLAFSLIANTKLLLTVDNNVESDSKKFRFLHGLRFFSGLWVVIGHGSIGFDDSSSGRMNILGYNDYLENCAISAAFISVDTFFGVSGFLLTYTVLRINRSGFIFTLVAIARRHIRANIPVFFVLMCFHVVPLVLSGPNTELLYNSYYEHISRHWWELLLQVRNFGKDLDRGMLAHIWYISTDFQLFLVGLILLQVFRNKFWQAISACLILSLLGCSVTAWQMRSGKYYPFPVILGETYSATIDTINDVYVMPTYHAVCYFTGCITMLLVQQYPEMKLSKIVQAVLWCTAISCGLTCVFIKYDWNRGAEPEGVPIRIVLTFFDRILWSVCMSWIGYACATGNGGILNRWLSWKSFVPFSRLTFGIYLIHLPVYFVIYHATRERIYYSSFNLATQLFGVFVWTTLLSWVLFLACEAPTGRLDKLLLMSTLMGENKKSLEGMALSNTISGSQLPLAGDVRSGLKQIDGRKSSTVAISFVAGESCHL